MNAIEMQQSAERVVRGAAYMDENYPGWERKVDTGILDIEDPSSCICGQVVPRMNHFGGWSVVNDDLEKKYPEDLNAIIDYGFTHKGDGDAWVSLIKERFDTGLLSDAMDFTAGREEGN